MDERALGGALRRSGEHLGAYLLAVQCPGPHLWSLRKPAPTMCPTIAAQCRAAFCSKTG